MPGESKEGIPARFFPDEAKDFMDSHPVGSYTLLDVRQPFEYEESHLPGATLLPLPKLVDSLDTLDPQKPVLVYCAVGGRSRMASQLLAGQGFREVYHIEGGIQAWEGATASGPVGFHLGFVKGDESAAEVIKTAYMMEQGLQWFHGHVFEQTSDAGLRKLLTHLIEAEESHKKSLLNLLEMVASAGEKDAWFEEILSNKSEHLMEGGFDSTDFMERNRDFMQSTEGYLEIAMMVEAQALDLYLRMAGESRNEAAREVLLRISEEEKAHLNLLARYMEEGGSDS